VDQNETPAQTDGGYWLLRDGTVLAAAEVASRLGERSKGLIGRRQFDGALILHHTLSVHSLGMRFAIDVAFLDRDLVVVDLTHLSPWRMTLPRIKARSVLEARAGAFERWGLQVGDHLELRCGR
jgi:uncharacterized protein